MDEDNAKLVTVYSTTNEAIVSFVKSLLDDNEIEYLVKGENWHETFPVAGAGGNIEIQVFDFDEERTKELLKDVDESEEIAGDEFDEIGQGDNPDITS
jgi:hypothetical protein